MHLNENNPKGKKGFGQFIKNTFIPSQNDTKQKRTSKIITCITTILILAIIIIGGLVVWKYASARIETKNNQDLMNGNSSVSSQSDNTEEVTAPTEKLPVDLDVETGVSTKFVDTYKTNDDFIGRITIADTKLDQPVVKGDDNAYYLDRTLEKKHNAFGVPFADYRSVVGLDIQSDNITMYGHAAKDGTFFAPVKEYSSLDFYKQHPTITFDTIYGDGEYKIIGRFIEYVDPGNQKMFNYHDYIDFGDEATYNKFVNSVKERSYFIAPVDTKYGDKFITLSTCNTEIINSNKTPYRDVLVARKVRPDEDKAVDVSKATINEKQLMPDGWVEKFGKKNPYTK